jgi:hypothetical protein
MRRLAALLLCLALLAPATPALAQNSPFGPLPQPAPTEAPTPDDNSSNILGQDVGRTTLYLIAGALLVTFVFIGWWISRDARRTLPQHRLSAEAERRRHDPRERHRRQREKERARKKTRAQKQARKAHRKR